MHRLVDENVHRAPSRRGFHNVLPFVTGALFSTLLGFSYVHLHGGVTRSDTDHVLERSAAMAGAAVQSAGANISQFAENARR